MKETRSEIFLGGDTVLYQGDCLEVMPLLESGTVDLVLCDPPYGTTRNKWDTVIDLDQMWSCLRRVTYDKSAIVLFAGQPFTSVLVMSNIKMFRQELVWCKNKATGHLNSKKRHMSSHESILLFSQKQVTYNPVMTFKGVKANYAKASSQSDCYNHSKMTTYKGGSLYRYPTTQLKFPVVNNDISREKRLHPTQKPVEIMEYLIRTYSNPGDTVLDFAMGSGTTGVACRNLDRNFIGIETDPAYFDIAKERIISDGGKK